jgi:phosphoserine phosphatase
VESWCAQNGYAMSQVAAVGDARSDITLFGRVGMSIALNATGEARRAADHVLDTRDLLDILVPLGIT